MTEEILGISLEQKIMLLKIGVNIIMGNLLLKEKNLLRLYILLLKRGNLVIHILKLRQANMMGQMRAFHQMGNNLKLLYIHMANMKNNMENIMIYFRSRLKSF